VIKGLSHPGIQVADVDRSIEFYELLGLGLAARWMNGRPYLQELIGFRGASLDVAIMSIPGSDSVFEILQCHGVERHRIDPATANTGTGHVCFLVEDLDAEYERLKHDVDFVSRPQIPDIGPNKGGRVVYLKDPDEIRVELLQTTARMA
jgi:lactoylglutathione lyase